MIAKVALVALGRKKTNGPVKVFIMQDELQSLHLDTRECSLEWKN